MDSGRKEDDIVTPHATGHVFASDGCLLRVDVIASYSLRPDMDPTLLSYNVLSARTRRCTDGSSSGGGGEECVDLPDTLTGRA
jgi:hypothetical protein